MDYIWSPWRYDYIKGSDRAPECVFCRIAVSDDDEEALVVHRGAHNFVVLNRYPYTSGHAMVIPYQHTASLQETSVDTLEEMMRLTRETEAAIRAQYRPDGVNIGMNIGKAAGAGVAGHIHMHVLPRWVADSNFITVVGETRVLPEDLAVTWRRLRDAFATPE